MKNIINLSLIAFGLIISYLILLTLLSHSSCGLKDNEFGDYVGGILNPLFALLSTAAIIYLTFIIAKNDDKKAAASILEQRRITINQMRHEALINLTNKLNSFAYELNNMQMRDVKAGTLKQRILTNMIKEDGKYPNLTWIIIHFELDGFLQHTHLFGNLFAKTQFTDAYNSISDTLGKLLDEQATIKMITADNLEKYIDQKQTLITIISDFILSEFD